jgi:protein-tyrosine phosphatase
MSLPAMHTAVGMSVPFLAGAAGFLRSRRATSKTLLILALAMIFCGLWAEVPDIPKFLSHTWSAHDPKYVNIFFFHGLLDKYQTEDRGLVEGFSIIMAIFFLILFACGKTALDNQRKIDRLEGMVPSSAIAPAIPKGIDYKNMVDIHCHVLPGVDDGPGTMDESVAMCRRIAELGVSHTVATPHLPWRGEYGTGKVLEAYNSLKKRLEDDKIDLKLSLGSDIRISWDLVERLKNRSVFTLADSKYFLLELDDLTVPERLGDFIGRCNAEGYYPIITHPERNVIFQSDINRLKEISRLPVLIQVSSCSLVGIGGGRVQKTAREFLGAGLVHIIASDAHAVNMRLEEFVQGLAVAQEIVGPEAVHDMVAKIPGLIVLDEGIAGIK